MKKGFFIVIFLLFVLFIINKNNYEKLTNVTNVYNYNQNKISNLSEIIFNQNKFYTYKCVNFLSKTIKDPKYLVVFFHGAIDQEENKNPKERIIFRGYDYNIKNSDILCISDSLIQLYNKYKVGYCLSTDKHNFENIYIEIFKYYIKKNNYEKVLFCGSSAGGYPSIHFASIFKQYALIANSQLYLEMYPLFTDFYKNFNHIEKILYENKNIEKHILQSNPKKIILYNNKLDYSYKIHTIPFIKFLKKNNLSHILELNLFEGNLNLSKKKTHHLILYDKYAIKKLDEVVSNYLN